MEWTEDAEQLMEKVPIFVRRFAKKKVEDYVKSQNRELITVENVYAVKNKEGDSKRVKEIGETKVREEEKINVQSENEKFNKETIEIKKDDMQNKNSEIEKMKINENESFNKEKYIKIEENKEIENPKDAKMKMQRGIEISEEQVREIERIAENERVLKSRFYEIKLCGAIVGCPLTLCDVEEIGKKIKEKIVEEKLEEFLSSKIKVALSHHRFKVSIAGCPNACSEPQIKDFGIIAKSIVKVIEQGCVGCLKCVNACRENCIEVKKIENKKYSVKIDYEKCVGCGDCVIACNKLAIIGENVLNRVLIGGKLGRHPHLAIEVSICNDEKTLKILENCIKLVKENNGERVGNIVGKIGEENIKEKLCE